MNVWPILRAFWPILLVLFLGVSVAQLSERLKNKTSVVYPSETLDSPASHGSDPMVRTNALLGTACILLATFWGFDALLSWWLFVPA